MTPTVIEKRKPLSEDARRSGWVGSNILLDCISTPGRIELVQSGGAVPREDAQSKFEQTAFLAGEDPDARDWTTAVMDCIDELNIEQGEQFEIANIYAFEDEFEELYPNNQHISAKIRQQLQMLRDEGLIEFLGDVEYRLRWVDDREGDFRSGLQ